MAKNEERETGKADVKTIANSKISTLLSSPYAILPLQDVGLKGGYTHYREKTATFMGELGEYVWDKLSKLSYPLPSLFPPTSLKCSAVLCSAEQVHLLTFRLFMVHL
jgi:hypothetical protein